jgi:hypothetical protein
VSLALGLTITKVSIVPAADYTGVCQKPGLYGYHISDRRDARAVARALIVSCYAGLHAQRLVDPAAPEHHGDSDEDDAFYYSKEWEVFPRWFGHVGDEHHRAYLDRLRAEAGRHVRRQRKAIEELAAALLDRKELTRAEVETLVEPLLVGVDGK